MASWELETEREEAGESKRRVREKRRWKYRDHCRRECENNTHDTRGNLGLPIIDFGLESIMHTEKVRLCDMGRVTIGQCFASSLRKRRIREGGKGRGGEEGRGGGKRKWGGGNRKAQYNYVLLHLKIFHISPHHQPTFLVKCWG